MRSPPLIARQSLCTPQNTCTVRHFPGLALAVVYWQPNCYEVKAKGEWQGPVAERSPGFCNWSRAIFGPETRMVALDVQDYATPLLKQSDDKSGKLTTDSGPCSNRNGRNVGQIVASARIQRIDGKSGNLGICPGFGK